MTSHRFALCLITALVFLSPISVQADLNIAVTIADDPNSTPLPPRFAGLSYESSELLPNNGHYYFDAGNQALLDLFHTLGVSSLRVGANAVDSTGFPVPQEKDIDALFAFARAAGVKVIYSFRLKNGDPAESARLAKYIAGHDADVLDCFAIGNEPEAYVKPFDKYLALWKPHYDAILQAVPDAMFDAPGGETDAYCMPMVNALFSQGRLVMISSHNYYLGSGRAAEKDLVKARAMFLSDDLHAKYEKTYKRLVTPLNKAHVPYRMDEMNSCYNGGAKGASNTYASTLWALDCLHWWAHHHILGLNFHTGDRVGRDGGFGAPNYSAFVRLADGSGFDVRPQAYAMLAFAQAAHGRPITTTLTAPAGLNFDAYAYRDGQTLYLTLINKSFGVDAQAVDADVTFPTASAAGHWQYMNLTQKTADITAATDVALQAPIDSQGNWTGSWQIMPGTPATGDLHVHVPPASAILLRDILQ